MAIALTVIERIIHESNDTVHICMTGAKFLVYQ